MVVNGIRCNSCRIRCNNCNRWEEKRKGRRWEGKFFCCSDCRYDWWCKNRLGPKLAGVDGVSGEKKKGELAMSSKRRQYEPGDVEVGDWVHVTEEAAKDFQVGEGGGWYQVIQCPYISTCRDRFKVRAKDSKGRDSRLRWKVPYWVVRYIDIDMVSNVNPEEKLNRIPLSGGGFVTCPACKHLAHRREQPAHREMTLVELGIEMATFRHRCGREFIVDRALLGDKWDLEARNEKHEQPRKQHHHERDGDRTTVATRSGTFPYLFDQLKMDHRGNLTCPYCNAYCVYLKELTGELAIFGCSDPHCNSEIIESRKSLADWWQGEEVVQRVNCHSCGNQHLRYSHHGRFGSLRCSSVGCSNEYVSLSAYLHCDQKTDPQMGRKNSQDISLKEPPKTLKVKPGNRQAEVKGGDAIRDAPKRKQRRVEAQDQLTSLIKTISNHLGFLNRHADPAQLVRKAAEKINGQGAAIRSLNDDLAKKTQERNHYERAYHELDDMVLSEQAQAFNDDVVREVQATGLKGENLKLRLIVLALVVINLLMVAGVL